MLKTPNNPAMLDPMSPNKSPWIKGKEATTVRYDFGPKKNVNVKGQAHLPAKVAAACALGTMEEPDANKEDSILEAIFNTLAAHEGNFEHEPQNADARSKALFGYHPHSRISRTRAS